MNHHELHIVDYILTDQHTCFLKVNGIDAATGEPFAGEIKFLRGRPYGDLIHPVRTQLSEGCREFVTRSLIGRFERGDFS